MNANKTDKIDDFQKDENSDYDSDSETAEFPEEKQEPPKPKFTQQSGDKDAPFQKDGEKRGVIAPRVAAGTLSLEDILRMGVSAQQLKKYGLKLCEGYTGHRGYLAYKNYEGNIFLFENEKGKDEYILRLYVENRPKTLSD